MKTMMEAFCTECRETFVPADEDDLEHGVREDGTPCGGLGQLVGQWVYTPELEGPQLTSAERVQNSAFETLIRDYTKRRDFKMVKILNMVYGRILDDRNKK